MYNLSNLEPKFKNFLRAENISNISLRNYLSDIRHFIGWIVKQSNYDQSQDLEQNLSKVNAKLIEEYKNDHIKSALPKKTTNRRLSALRKFFLFCQKEALLDNNPAKQVSNITMGKNINKLIKQEVVKNEMPKKNNTTTDSNVLFSFKKLHVILFSTLLIVVPLLTFLLKNLKTKVIHIPVLASEQTGKRLLVFTGKVRDSLGNVITTKTDVIFSLYNQPDGGKPLYTSSCLGETGAITPDVNGNVRIVIGSDCDGKAIPSKLFSENPNIYLGITVSSDAEMKPRQKIPNVGYATDSDTVEGFSLGNNELTVPYINDNGDLLIAAANAGIRSTYESSNFSISSAESVTIQAASTGDVVLEATGSGGIKLRTGGLSDSYSRLFINEEGKIGIGTLFPSYDLEVSGDVKITDGNKLIIGSSSYDPSGINGAIYYNTKSNRIRCFQNNVWSDCFSQSEKTTIGGIATPLLYDGKLENGNTSDLAEERILEAKNFLADNFSSLASNIQNLAFNLISVREKIISPVIETKDLIATGKAQIAKVETNEIKPRDRDLIVDLNNEFSSGSNSSYSSSEERSDESRSRTNKGPLASLIIRGLEGKTAATIDATGNASFSGQLAADSLNIANDATISGTLTAKNISTGKLEISGNLSADQATLSGKLVAKEIEAENIQKLQEQQNVILNSFQDLKQIPNQSMNEFQDKVRNDNNESIEQLSNDVNKIQSLLAEIKNQPLSDPQYYQNLPSDQQLTINDQQFSNQTIEQLTVTGSSNLYNLAVTGSSTIGQLLIQDNSILSLAWDLKLSALSTIKLFDDAVVISKDGTLTTRGAIIAQGGIKTNKIEPLNSGEKVTISNLAINNLAIENKYLSATSSSAVIETQLEPAGIGYIPGGESEATIYSNLINEDSLIYLTPTSSSPVGNITVVKKETCDFSRASNSNYSSSDPDVTSGGSRSCKPYFKVAVVKPVDFPILFNWLIIN